MAVNIGGAPVEDVVIVSEEWGRHVRYVMVTGQPAGVIYGRKCRLVGWSVRETTGSTAAGFDLMDGGSVNDSAPVTVNLLAGASSFGWVGHPGPKFDGGMFYNPRTGTIAGAVWVEDLGP